MRPMIRSRRLPAWHDMAMVVAAALPGSPLEGLVDSAAFVTDPYPILARLRREDPVHWVPSWGCWLISRAEDIEATIRDTRRFSSADRVTSVIERMPDWNDRLGALHENFAVGMAQRDPPDHTRVRGLVSAAFTPRRVEALRPRVEQLVDEHLDRVVASGRCLLYTSPSPRDS